MQLFIANGVHLLRHLNFDTLKRCPPLGLQQEKANPLNAVIKLSNEYYAAAPPIPMPRPRVPLPVPSQSARPSRRTFLTKHRPFLKTSLFVAVHSSVTTETPLPNHFLLQMITFGDEKCVSTLCPKADGEIKKYSMYSLKRSIKFRRFVDVQAILRKLDEDRNTLCDQRKLVRHSELLPHKEPRQRTGSIDGANQEFGHFGTLQRKNNIVEFKGRHRSTYTCHTSPR